MKPAVLVTQRLPASAMAQLASGCTVDLHAGRDPLPPAELRGRLQGKAGLVCLFQDTIDRRLLEAAPGLRVVANVGVGYDHIDVACAQSRGIVVTNTPDVLTAAVAELTWGLILAVSRRIAEGDRLIRAGRWQGWTLDFMLGTELHGKQLGIVGPGRIGRAVAERAAAFGMRVVAAGREPPAGAPRGADTAGGEWRRVLLDELLVTSDVVSLHVPLSAGTRHLVDRRALTRMKRTALLINTARGAVVDEAALVWALEERLIAGAALDVYEREPAVAEGLLALENVVLAPHLGSGTRETRAAMAELAVANALAVLGGQPPLTPVRAGEA